MLNYWCCEPFWPSEFDLVVWSNVKVFSSIVYICSGAEAKGAITVHTKKKERKKEKITELQITKRLFYFYCVHSAAKDVVINISTALNRYPFQCQCKV